MSDPVDPRKLLEKLDWRAFTPEDSPMTPMDVMANPVHRALSTPDLADGDPAFDFDLPVHDFSDGTEKETGRRFHLREASGERPVALIFGSYT